MRGKCECIKQSGGAADLEKITHQCKQCVFALDKLFARAEVLRRVYPRVCWVNTEQVIYHPAYIVFVIHLIDVLHVYQIRSVASAGLKRATELWWQQYLQ